MSLLGGELVPLYRRTIFLRNTVPFVMHSSQCKLRVRIAIPCGEAKDLTGQTSQAEIAVLARGASIAIGNDTGPMHMIAAAGCPTTVLFSAVSDPTLTAPRGPAVTVLKREPLADLSVAEVAATLSLR